MPYIVKYDSIINDLCMPQFKVTSDHFNSSFSASIFFVAVYESLLSRHAYFSKRQSSHLWTFRIRRERKKIPSSSESYIFEYKMKKAASDLFYYWLFINFSFLPNLSVFQTTFLSNSPLSKIIDLALLSSSRVLSSLFNMSSLFFRKLPNWCISIQNLSCYLKLTASISDMKKGLDAQKLGCFFSVQLPVSLVKI